MIHVNRRAREMIVVLSASAFIFYFVWNVLARGPDIVAVYITDAALPLPMTIPVVETSYPARAVSCIRALVIDHEPINGSRIVAIHQIPRRQSVLVQGQEEFEILSLEFGADIIGHTVALPSPDVTLRYSQGRLYGLHRCIGRVGRTAEVGHMSVQPVGEKLQISVSARIPLHESGWDGPLVHGDIRRDFAAVQGQPQDVLGVFFEALSYYIPNQRPYETK